MKLFLTIMIIFLVTFTAHSAPGDGGPISINGVFTDVKCVEVKTCALIVRGTDGEEEERQVAGCAGTITTSSGTTCRESCSGSCRTVTVGGGKGMKGFEIIDRKGTYKPSGR
jgi:hypothetical protein